MREFLGAAVTVSHSDRASTGMILDLRRTKPIQRTSFGFSLKGRKELATSPEMQTKGNPSVSGTGLKISLDIWRLVRYSTLGVRIRADERARPAATELCRS